MKPTRLAISGLQSFRERQEIDFTALTEMGMFGIFGPTGSGKSTILDAITLALYGDVGRAGRNTQAILNHAEKRLEVAFEFDIGSLGKRKRYRVERAYKRGSGFSVEHQASRLLQLEIVAGSSDYGIVVVADTKNTVNQAIRSILGLEESDFTRAVVLPQGKFAEFLQLTGSERNAMTERLFGLERYGKSLIDKVSTRVKQVTSEHAQVIAGQAELGDASDAAVQAAEAIVQEAQTQLQSAKQAHTDALARLREVEQVHTLMAQREAAQGELDALAKREKEMAVLKRSLNRDALAQAVWPVVVAVREAERAANQANEVVATRIAALQEAQTALAEAERQQADAEQRRNSLEPELIQKQGRLTDAQELENRLLSSQGELAKDEAAHHAAKSQMQAVLSKRTVAFEQVEGLNQQQREMNALLTEHTTSPEMRQHLGALRKVFDMWIERKSVEQRALEQYEERGANRRATEDIAEREKAVLEELRREQQTLGQQMDNLLSLAPMCTQEDLRALRTWMAEVKPRVDALCTAERDFVDVKMRCEKAHDTSLRQMADMQAMRVETDRKEKNWHELDAERDRRAASMETALIAELVARLENGSPCPVCGSEHHPNPTQSEGDGLSGESSWTAEDEAKRVEAQEAWRQADTAVRKAETECAKLQTAAQMLDDARDRQQQHHNQVSQELSLCWQSRGSEIVDVSVMPQDGKEWKALLVRFNAKLVQALQALQNWEAERAGLTIRQTELNERIQQAIQVLAVAQAGVVAAEQEAAKQLGAVNEAATDCQTAGSALVQVMLALGLVVDGEVGKDFAPAVQARLQQLADGDKLADEARRSLVSLSEQLTDARANLQVAEDELHRAELALGALELQLQQVKEDVEERKQQLHQITGGTTVAEGMKNVELALRDIRDRSEQTKEAWQAASRVVEMTQQSATKAQSELELLRNTANGALDRLTDALARAEFATVQEVTDALLEDGEQSERSATLKQFEEAVRQWTQRGADLERQLAGREIDEATWSTVRDAANEAESSYGVALEAFGSKHERLTDILRRKERWQALEQKRVEVESLVTRLSALQSSLRGNSFVQYIAREQLERVARQASDRLAALTHGRYALTLTDDGSFLMQDDHNGGALRPVSTLSGGETFLTSLSLALALSAHIQLRGQHPLEFFFLDEGFGTLDPDLLDVVLSSLEKLNLERLSIGLISHVPELRQRMHRRVIVEPALPAGRGSKVTLELG